MPGIDRAQVFHAPFRMGGVVAVQVPQPGGADVQDARGLAAQRGGREIGLRCATGELPAMPGRQIHIADEEAAVVLSHGQQYRRPARKRARMDPYPVDAFHRDTQFLDVQRGGGGGQPKRQEECDDGRVAWRIHR